MKSVFELLLLAFAITGLAGAQEPATPALQQGVSVEMPKAKHAVEMRAADEASATIVTVSADGRVFVGAQPSDVASLRNLKQGPIYVKADARAPYQQVLTVLDALQGRSVVLLAAPENSTSATKVSPQLGAKAG